MHTKTNAKAMPGVFFLMIKLIWYNVAFILLYNTHCLLHNA
jgi:hypothetical protein